jgi:hypothetical protein
MGAEGSCPPERRGPVRHPGCDQLGGEGVHQVLGCGGQGQPGAHWCTLLLSPATWLPVHPWTTGPSPRSLNLRGPG